MNDAVDVRALKFDDQGVIPAVVQDAESGQVLIRVRGRPR